MEINYTALPTFAKLHKDPNLYLFCMGPVGSGKSSGCIMHVLLNAVMQNPDSRGIRESRYAIIRSSFPKLKSTTIKTWKLWFKDQVQVTYGSPIVGKMNFPLADGTKVETELLFLPLETDDDVEKLQSLELTGAHINEASEVSRHIFDMLKTRIGRFPERGGAGVTKKFILLDYNAVPTDHWLYQIAEEDKPRKHSFYRQPPAMLYENGIYKTNPDAENIEHLDEDYYEDMVLGTDEDFVNVFILNNYGDLRHGRPVYKAYDDRIHATETVLQPLQGVPLIVGMDCGLTPACAITQLTPTGQFILYDEIVTENCSIQEFAEDFLWPKMRTEYSKFKFEVVVDPAARERSQNDKRSAMDLLLQAGLPVRLAKTNEKLARREAVNFFLRKLGGFIVNGTKAPISRKGFISEYKFEKLNSIGLLIRHKETPEKNIYSHIHEAIQYAAVEAVGGRISSRRKRPHKQEYIEPADISGY
jgi:hypothetical protein